MPNSPIAVYVATQVLQAMYVSWHIPGQGFIYDAETIERDLNEAQKALKHVMAEVNRLHATGVSFEVANQEATAQVACEAPDKKLI